MAVHVSLGTARNHVCRDDPCPICQGRPIRRRRSYRCPTCDVFGKGLRCWSCGSTDLEWNRMLPAPKTTASH